MLCIYSKHVTSEIVTVVTIFREVDHERNSNINPRRPKSLKLLMSLVGAFTRYEEEGQDRKALTAKCKDITFRHNQLHDRSSIMDTLFAQPHSHP